MYLASYINRTRRSLKLLKPIYRNTFRRVLQRLVKVPLLYLFSIYTNLIEIYVSIQTTRRLTLLRVRIYILSLVLISYYLVYLRLRSLLSLTSRLPLIKFVQTLPLRSILPFRPSIEHISVRYYLLGYIIGQLYISVT